MDSATGSEFYIPRSDGWTVVTIDDVDEITPLGGSYCGATDSNEILTDIFYPGALQASWETVNVDCPLKCKVQANFVFVRHSRYDATQLAVGLRARAVLVRQFKLPRIEQFLRISIGTPAQSATLIGALRELLAA